MRSIQEGGLFKKTVYLVNLPVNQLAIKKMPDLDDLDNNELLIDDV